MIRRFTWAVAVAVMLAMIGCTTVKPYQRQQLASPVMEAEPDPLGAKLDGHVWEYREGSVGGVGVGGGGCGCN